MHRFVADRCDADARGEHRGDRVRFGRHIEDGEGHLGHDAITLLRSVT